MKNEIINEQFLSFEEKIEYYQDEIKMYKKANHLIIAERDFLKQKNQELHSKIMNLIFWGFFLVMANIFLLFCLANFRQ